MNPPKILIVDDDEHLLRALQRTLGRKYDIITCAFAKEAVKLLKVHHFTVIISDMMMPEIKGSEFLAIAKEKSPDSIRILLTGESSLADSIDAVNHGQIFRFLTKPCSTEDLTSAIDASIRQVELLNVEQEVLEETLKGAVSLMVDIICMVRPEIFTHSLNIRKKAIVIAKAMKYPKLWEVEIASLLSHLGCVTIDDTIIKKRFNNEDMSPSEWDIFYSHIDIGSKLIGKIPRLQNLSSGLLYLEKEFGGGGYPKDTELKGFDIPLLGRILKAAHEYTIGVNSLQSHDYSVARIQGESGLVDPDINRFLQSEGPNVQIYLEPKTIEVQDVTSGMVLNQDLYQGDILLLSKNHEVTDTMRLCIRKLWESKKISGTVNILLPRFKQNK